MRPASLIHASRYGSSRLSFQVANSESRQRSAAVLSSSRSRCNVAGWDKRLWKMVRSKMAVVSLPAVILDVVHAVSALS